jgi:hypothetical protein
MLPMMTPAMMAPGLESSEEAAVIATGVVVVVVVLVVLLVVVVVGGTVVLVVIVVVVVVVRSKQTPPKQTPGNAPNAHAVPSTKLEPARHWELLQIPMSLQPPVRQGAPFEVAEQAATIPVLVVIVVVRDVVEVVVNAIQPP